MNIVLPIAIFGFVFSTIMPVRFEGVGGGLGFTLYLCAGLLPWSALTESLNRGTGAFQQYAAYLRKLDVPQAVFVASAATGPFFTLVFGLTLLLPVGWAAGLQPAVAWLLLPVPVVLLWVFAFGLGSLLAPLQTLHRDTALVVQVATQFGFWLVPIVYVTEVVPAAMRVVFMLHPFQPFLTIFRQLLLHGDLPAASVWLAAMGWSFGALITGHLTLKALQRDVRDAL